MRYPTLRYGNPVEMRHYAAGIPLAELAKSLRRDIRTVRDWLSGARSIPFWVPELMRLRALDQDYRLSQMIPHDLLPRRTVAVTQDGTATTPEPTTAPDGAVPILRAA